MELQVTQENLSKALNTVARVASGRSTLPILSNVLLRVIDNRLSISATNLDIAITQYLGAKVIKPGSLTVPARLTQDFISSLPSSNVELKQQDHKLQITAPNYNSTINGTQPDEFPVMPAIENGKTWEIASSELKKGLQQVVVAASSDESRPVLTGIFIHTHEHKLFAVATDSYRLAEKNLGDNNLDISLLIPATAIADLLRIMGDFEGQIRVTHDDQQVLFNVGEVELVARLIDGEYPDYRKLIPQKFTTTAELSHKELTNITKVSSLFARESAGSITFEVSEKESQVSIRSVASQLGENTSKASAKVKGEGEITLNSRYLLDGLAVIGGQEVKVSFNGKVEPVMITSLEDKTYTHIVMPLKS